MALPEPCLYALYPTGGLEKDTNTTFTTGTLAALNHPEYVDGLSHQQQENRHRRCMFCTRPGSQRLWSARICSQDI
jgi:hypothetical protein